MSKTALHNHVTGDIRAPGKCPACTEYHRSQFTCWRDPAHQAVNQTIYGWPQCGICRAAPPYHERPSYLHEDFVLGLYVPADGRATAIIAERSAVVGLPDGGEGDDAWTQIYYEGWINGPMQYGDRDARGLWEAGVEHAASRMVTAYPTVAQANLPAGTLQYVGLYWPVDKRIVVDNEGALERWLA